jgi:hypothetical protein
MVEYPRILYQQIAQPVLPPALIPERVSEDKWHRPFEEPVRFKPALHPTLHQFLAQPPAIVVPFGWFGALTEPVRYREFYRALNQWEFEQPNGGLNINMGWYRPLNEPVRFRVIPTANIDFPSQILPTVPYSAGTFLPMLYQQPVGSIANSGVWRGRGLQK